MTELEGKRAIITGAASGIGRATAELFVKEGARVLIADISEETGKGLVRELGSSAVFKRTDVTQAQDVASAVEFALQEFGGLDIMFNNAGVAEPANKVSLVDEEFASFNKVLAVDLLGPMLGIKYAGRAMRAQGSGTIINTASTGGFYAGFGMPIYRAAKAGVIQLTQMAAVELGGYGIRVNCVSPGPIETPMAAAGFPAGVAMKIAEATSRLLTEMQLLKRTGKPCDIANAVLFLASDRAANITGHNLVVDGGATVGDKIDRLELMEREFRKIMS